MKNFTSHFLFNKQQRNGILLLGCIIAGIIVVPPLIPRRSESTLDVNSPELVVLQKHLDSLRCLQLAERQPKIYPFNPNFLTDYRAYTLGLEPEVVDRLQAFRNRDQWIRSARQFKEVTGVSDEVLARIAPYFKFPEWVNTTSKQPFKTHHSVSLSWDQKQDLNTTTAEALEVVYGIGPTLSKRIISYRDRLGGFSDSRQLNLVYGLKAEVIDKLLERFAVKTPKPLVRWNINTASASDLSTIPGISFELAKEIWEFRRLRDSISDLSELKKIAGLDARKYQLIELYLQIE